MKTKLYKLTVLTFLWLIVTSQLKAQQTLIRYDKTRDGFLVFHPIKTDAKGKIIPWNNTNTAKAYDEIIKLTWCFWDTMKRDINGIPYYMNHQVWWEKGGDHRGIGGDQIAMALSSFQLLYMYSGNEKVKQNMRFMIEYYLTNGLSAEGASWPNIPYPYNNFLYSGVYDGDMVLGREFTQPDKAGSFGWELLKFYKLFSKRWFVRPNEEMYLEYAIKIANTLAAKTKDGDADNSPLPFRVNAKTGEVGVLTSNDGTGKVQMKSGYSTNWSSTLNLFEGLIKLKVGDTLLYKGAHKKILDWLKAYPIKNQRWGPFFEDVPGWSDTQINAVTMAQYMMEHAQFFPSAKDDVQKIFQWVNSKLGNKGWEKYGVLAINEQTAYETPGNSHTSRQGCAELQYAVFAKDTTGKDAAIRKLNWATYMVDSDGKNCYMQDEVWLTDGYGDFIRHYLRAMAAFPELCPNENHILSSTDIVIQADYAPDFNKSMGASISVEEAKTAQIYYQTFEEKSTETIRMIQKPKSMIVDWKPLEECKVGNNNCWSWTPLKQGGGLLKVNKNGKEAKVFY